MSRTPRRYPSDLSDVEWALLEPLLASSERRGRPPKWPAKRVADAIFYVLRGGCALRLLPHDDFFLPWQRTPTTTTSGRGTSTVPGGGYTPPFARGCVA